MRIQPLRLLAGLLALLVLVAMAPIPASAQAISVYVDGRRLDFDQPPVMLGGRTLVPLRGIFEALGATVVWEPSTRTIRAQKDSTSLELPLGSPLARVNGQSVALETPAQSVGGRTMVPLRFLGEALGTEVKWHGATRTIEITSPGATPGASPSPAAGAPQIRQVVVSPQRALGPGDTLTVVMTGDPGGQASFDVVGVRSGIPMVEGNPGSYRGELVVPSGMRADSATLLVRLVRQGQEALQPAPSPVTLGPVTPSTPSAPTMTVFPTPDAVVADRRPAVGATFSAPIQAGRVRLFVDGQEFTSQATVSGTELSWRPGWDLSPGPHTARLSGVDNLGVAVERQWSFTLGQTGLAVRSPASGATVQELRPTVGLTFPQAVRTETVRLWVDGQEFTGQARITAYEVSWTPGWDLAPGTHGVRVDATTPSGLFLNEVWSFQIQATSGGASNPLQVTVSSPANRQGVPGNFNVVGRATPNATVDVVAQEYRALIPGVIAVPGQTVRGTAVADASGNFNVALGATEIPAGSTMDVQVTARDVYGNTSAPVTFQVVRQ